MALQYRIYTNDWAGGPVDRSTPYATVADPGTGPGVPVTWDTPALPPGCDATFEVHCRDTVSGLEEDDASSRIRIRLDADGVNREAFPGVPQKLTGRATGDGASLAWAYGPGRMGLESAPTGFHVYVDDPDFLSPPALTVPYVRGRFATYATLTGLSPGPHDIAVRAYNTSGEGDPSATITVTVPSAGPDAVTGLDGAPA